MNTKHSKSQVEELLKYLKELQFNSSNTALRRENAVWAATLLYFTICYLLFKFAFDNKEKIPEISIFIIIPVLFLIVTFFFLFILFIHTNYGLYTNDMSFRSILMKYIFILINKKELPENFDWQIDPSHSFPETIMNELRNDTRNRHEVNIDMIFSPYKFFLNFLKKKIIKDEIKKQKSELLNREIQKIQLHEAIIYNIIFIPTIILIMFFCLIFFKIIK